ncbi:hypothetical protein Hte_012498 [Hypoxylon texense]
MIHDLASRYGYRRHEAILRLAPAFPIVFAKIQDRDSRPLPTRLRVAPRRVTSGKQRAKYGTVSSRNPSNGKTLLKKRSSNTLPESREETPGCIYFKELEPVAKKPKIHNKSEAKTKGKGRKDKTAKPRVANQQVLHQRLELET